MFKIITRDITQSGNFILKLDNGFQVSIALGGGTYSSGSMKDGFETVEIAVVDPDGNFVDQGSGSGVEGWQSANQFIEILNRTNAIPSAERANEMVREIEDTLIRLRYDEWGKGAKELASRNGLVKNNVPTQAGIDFLSAFSDQPRTRSDSP